jgi:uncharacterized protein YcaQ
VLLACTQRKFGYFCLPVLYGDKFIGRIDAKADRANENFIINNFFPENGFKRTTKQTALSGKNKKTWGFAGCSDISF